MPEVETDPNAELSIDQATEAIVSQTDPEPEDEEIEEQPEGDEVGEEEEEDEQPAAASTPAPSSWDAEGRKLWDSLDDPTRQAILKRETDRDRAVAISIEKQSALGKKLEAISSAYKEHVPLLRSEFERKWGGVDWPAVAREFPDNYNEIKAEHDADKDALEKAQKAAKEAEDTAFNQFRAEEDAKLAKLLPELAEPEKGQQRVGKLIGFLSSSGFTPQQIREASAAELSIAYDAMRWRESVANAKRKSELPRKEPGATLKAIKPSGGASSSPTRDLQGLETKLTKSGRVDDAVALLVARNQRAQRKRA